MSHQLFTVLDVAFANYWIKSKQWLLPPPLNAPSLISSVFGSLSNISVRTYHWPIYHDPPQLLFQCQMRTPLKATTTLKTLILNLALTSESLFCANNRLIYYLPYSDSRGTPTIGAFSAQTESSNKPKTSIRMQVDNSQGQDSRTAGMNATMRWKYSHAEPQLVLPKFHGFF